MRVGFLVGDIGHISGGSNVIIEHAAGLVARGIEVDLICAGEPDLESWHPRLRKLSIKSIRECQSGRPYDFLFATWWLTWFDLHQLEARVYGYLNQSFESRFHPERPYKRLNRVTYSLPLFFVTEARWLEEFINHLQPAARTVYVPNGLSREYFPIASSVPASTGPLKVVVEGPWGVSFKGVAQAFDQLAIAAQDIPLKVTWLTSNSGGHKPMIDGKPVRIHERIRINEVADVLREADVMVKLSTVEGMFGPPLEMFSQGGTAITTPVSGSDEYIVHGKNSLVAPSTDATAVSRYIELLHSRRDYLATLRRGALETAKAWPDWAASTGQLATALEGAMREGYANHQYRSSLAGMSALRNHWLDNMWKLESQLRAVPHLGEGEWLLMKRYRELKGSETVKALRRYSPPALREVMREYVRRVLE